MTYATQGFLDRDQIGQVRELPPINYVHSVESVSINPTRDTAACRPESRCRGNCRAHNRTGRIERLAEWLESDAVQTPKGGGSDDPEIGFALAMACAVYAHLYIAWLHPFGDGNGRTARLLDLLFQFLILARSGMAPLPAAHLLSNHYNLTRDQYYRELAKASSTGRTETAEELMRRCRQLADGSPATEQRASWTAFGTRLHRFASCTSK